MPHTPEPEADAIDAGTEYTVAPIRGDIVEVYEGMIADIPEAGGDGLSNILEAIATASELRDLDEPWRSSGLEKYINERIRITGLRRMPSSFQGGLPFFLVVDAGVVKTGELVTITTGSVSVVAQLAKAHQLGRIPFDCIPRQSARPSKAGYYPQHLEIVGQ